MANLKACALERGVDFSVGFALLGLGTMFSVIGLTVLPVLGLVPAALSLGLSIPFLKARPAKSCYISR